MTWPPGTAVICIDDSRPAYPGVRVEGAPLVKDRRYTVRTCGYANDRHGRRSLGITLAENRMVHPEFDHDGLWIATRFRRCEPTTEVSHESVAEELCV